MSLAGPLMVLLLCLRPPFTHLGACPGSPHTPMLLTWDFCLFPLNNPRGLCVMTIIGTPEIAVAKWCNHVTSCLMAHRLPMVFPVPIAILIWRLSKMVIQFTPQVFCNNSFFLLYYFWLSIKEMWHIIHFKHCLLLLYTSFIAAELIFKDLFYYLVAA